MATLSTTYIRIARLPIPDVMEAIRQHYEKYSTKGKDFKKRQSVLGYELKLDSLRLKTFFVRGTVCSCCGLKATHFAVEKHKSADPNLFPHLNLWGINSKGEEVLFTHDHTLARSLGGLDALKNTTTMCSVCNEDKSVEERLLKEAINKEMAQVA